MIPVLEALALLAAANGTPVLAQWLLGPRWAAPLDGGRCLADGRPLLGASKTIRGLVLGVLATTLLGAVLGQGAWKGAWTGTAFGALSMAGDLASSFVKRRLGIAPSGRALGLDQIPESLLPVLGCGAALGLDIVGSAVVVTAFLVLELVTSRVLFRLGIRKRPY